MRTYVCEKNPQELTDTLQYFSRMIPILDTTPDEVRGNVSDYRTASTN